MYFNQNIHVVLLEFGSYSLRFPVTLRISCEQSSWVRGENPTLPVQVVPHRVHHSNLFCLLQLHDPLGAAVLVEGSQELGQENHHSAP